MTNEDVPKKVNHPASAPQIYTGGDFGMTATWSFGCQAVR
jgi:hypothetical protein